MKIAEGFSNTISLGSFTLGRGASTAGVYPVSSGCWAGYGLIQDQEFVSNPLRRPFGRFHSTIHSFWEFASERTWATSNRMSTGTEVATIGYSEYLKTPTFIDRIVRNSLPKFDTVEEEVYSLLVRNLDLVLALEFVYGHIEKTVSGKFVSELARVTFDDFYSSMLVVRLYLDYGYNNPLVVNDLITDELMERFPKSSVMVNISVYPIE